MNLLLSDAQLAKFYFDFAGEPDFIEHRAVKLGDGRFIGIGNAFPAVRLQSVNECCFIGDAE